MSNTDLVFENILNEELIELNGGGVLSTIVTIVSVCISVYGVYETGKNHIYEYNYNKAYDAEMERLNQSSRSYGSGDKMVLQAQ